MRTFRVIDREGALKGEGVEFSDGRCVMHMLQYGSLMILPTLAHVEANVGATPDRDLIVEPS